MQRRSFVSILGVALVGLFAFGAQAQSGEPAFKSVNPPQPGGVNGQIEVTEFFSYGCSHCAAFEPLLAKWRGEQAKDVSFRRVPVSFGNPSWATFGRIYLTLNALGLNDKLDSQVFDAIHRNRIRLDDEKTRNEWLGKQGVDVKKFNDTWRSFTTETAARRSEQLAEVFKIMAVPSIVINGKFLIEGGGPEALTTANQLIARERGAAKAPAAQAAPAKAPAAPAKK